MPDVTAMGSNGYGIGSDVSQTEYGLQLGNPHFPWRGNLRFYMVHLTIPGQLDVMGATITGLPIVVIGFNQNVAWSHTVSTGRRFTLYEVTLVEGDPMKYVYDDEERTDNIYFTHYGPVIDGGVLSDLLGSWPNLSGTLLTYRDANLTNNRAMNDWEAVDRAQSIDDLEEASKLIGNPWTNTIAADRNGGAFYGDISVVPNVTNEQLDACNDSFILGQINDFGYPALNGSRSECEWGSDEDAPEEGIFGHENLPKLRSREYVGNSDDSYWLSNPDELLTGFARIIGREEVPQTTRTRQGFMQAEALMNATDRKSDTPGYDIELLQDMLCSNMDIVEQLIRTDVVTICEAVTDWSAGDCDAKAEGNQPYSANPTETAAACTVFANWDGLHNVDSVGSSVWREMVAPSRDPGLVGGSV